MHDGYGSSVPLTEEYEDVPVAMVRGAARSARLGGGSPSMLRISSAENRSARVEVVAYRQG